jgi:hypothetical protein
MSQDVEADTLHGVIAKPLPRSVVVVGTALGVADLFAVCVAISSLATTSILS